MKKIFDRYFIYALALIFTVSGYFIGSSRQKVYIVLAMDKSSASADKPAAISGLVNSLPPTADKAAANNPVNTPVSAPVKKTAPPGKSDSVKVSPKPAPVMVMPTPEPVTSAPAPATSVS